MQLTEAFAKQVSAPPPTQNGKASQTFYRDSEIIGFGLRVSTGGTKSWILERRIRGKVKRITLGRCNVISLEKAKSRALKLIQEIERENAPRIINAKLVKKTINLQQAFRDYIKAHPKLCQRTINDYQYSMHGPLNDWLTIPVQDISEARILDKHHAYAKKNKARCNNAMRLLRAILNHVKRHLADEHHKPIILSNPVDILSRQQLWYSSNKRRPNHLIKPEQLKKWWHATLKIQKKTTRKYFHFLLLTGLPKTIVSNLRIEDVDFDKMCVQIRLQTDKTSSFSFPLTDHLIELIKNITQEFTDDSIYLFPGINKKTAITDPRSSIKYVQEISGILFGLNDLYRTFIFFAKQTGMDHESIEFIYNNRNRKQIMFTDNEILIIRHTQKNIFEHISDIVKS